MTGSILDAYDDGVGAATIVPITPSVLDWAMEQANVTNAEMADRCNVTRETVASWRSGQLQPTKTQFKALVSLVRRPTAFFFLAEPPADEGVPAAFRHPSKGQGTRDLLRVESTAIRTARRLQKVSSWVLAAENAKPLKLPRATVNSSAEEAAESLRKFLRWSTDEQLKAKDSAQVVRLLRRRLEDIGFLVLHLPLSNDGCRGFSLFDSLAPLIAINTAYNSGARVFSYGHELGHLALQTDGICTSRITPGVERWCEEFSAAFLMPPARVRSFVHKTLNGDGGTFFAARKVSNCFNVSLRAAAVQLIHLGFASSALYREVDKTDHKTGSGGAGGETSPEKRLREWGSIYPQLLFEAEERSLLNRQDVLEYLNLSNTQAATLHRLLSSGAKRDE